MSDSIAATAPAFMVTVTGPNGVPQTMTPAAFLAALLADPAASALTAPPSALPPAGSIKDTDGVVLVQNNTLVEAPAAAFVGFAEYLIGKKLGA